MKRLNSASTTTTGDVSRIAHIIRATNSFEVLCQRILVKSYGLILTRKLYRPGWEEDTFSANFKEVAEEICLLDAIPIHIEFQQPQITQSILTGAIKPNTAKRMDLVFSQLIRPKKLRYGVEAKILMSRNTKTRNAKHLCDEYIVSGIDRFINRDYFISGCMVGYIVNGTSQESVELLNRCFSALDRKKEIIKDKHTIEGFAECYQSSHAIGKMKHFFFVFN